MFYGEDVVTPVSAASCQSLPLLAIWAIWATVSTSNSEEKNVLDTSGYTKNGILLIGNMMNMRIHHGILRDT
jgi:hypothetical protein